VSGAQDPDDKPSSPICHLDEADDRYAGFLDRDELAAQLRDILASRTAIAGKLRSLLPKARDDTMHGEIAEILKSEEVGVARLEMLLAALTGS
jgi:hypothetical protein